MIIKMLNRIKGMVIPLRNEIDKHLWSELSWIEIIVDPLIHTTLAVGATGLIGGALYAYGLSGGIPILLSTAVVGTTAGVISLRNRASELMVELHDAGVSRFNERLSDLTATFKRNLINHHPDDANFKSALTSFFQDYSKDHALPKGLAEKMFSKNAQEVLEELIEKDKKGMRQGRQ